MATYLESDREVTIDGVGLLTPGVQVEVDQDRFRTYHNVDVGSANLPSFIKVTLSEEEEVPEEAVEATEEVEESKVGLADVVAEFGS